MNASLPAKDVIAPPGRRPLEPVHIFSVIVCCLTLVLGLVGNGAVLCVTARPARATVNTVWFLGLALADLAFCLILPAHVTYLVLGFHWPLGRALCKASAYVSQLSLLWSSFTVALISADRGLSVARPVWSQNHRRPRLARQLAASACLAAAILSGPILVYRHTATVRDGRVICYMSYLTPSEQARQALAAAANNSAFRAFMQEVGPSVHGRARAYTLAVTTLGFLVPIGVMVASYALVGLRVRAHGRRGSTRPFRVMAAVVAAFIVCLLPLQVFKVLELAAATRPGLRPVLRLGSPLANNLAFVNSCLNPILYLAMGRGFRGQRRPFRRAMEAAMTDYTVSSRRHSSMETRSVSLGGESAV